MKKKCLSYGQATLRLLASSKGNVTYARLASHHRSAAALSEIVLEALERMEILLASQNFTVVGTEKPFELGP